MRSSAVVEPSEVVAALDDLDGVLKRLADMPLDGCSLRLRLHAVERLESARRHTTAVSYDLIASLDTEDPADLGGPLSRVLADTVRINTADARRRVRTAAQLAERTTVTGQPLPPQLPATATAWRAGHLDEHHVQVIAAFLRDLPHATPPTVAETAEAFLAEHATRLRPDQLDTLAARYAIVINPDGHYTDTDRARHRGFTWSPQRRDGMSIGRLTATPELRAHLDAWLARFAAPGMSTPERPDTELTDGDAGTDHADLRSRPQRQHDALYALVRRQLGDPALGHHNGLPVTVIVSTTLTELHNAAGYGTSAGGTLIPMRDVIRLAANACHYLAVFDDHQQRPLYLGRARRLASPDQRLLLHALDRGCTFPGCDAPGYLCQVHHLTDWAHGGRTDITNLTFACGPHHKLADHGWTTTKLANGQTQWIPPPHHPRRATTNITHHPERQLPNDDAGNGLHGHQSVQADEPDDNDDGAQRVR